MIWTKEEDEALKKLYPRIDIPKDQIKKVLPNRSWHAVEHRAHFLGLNRQGKGRLDKKEMERLEKVYGI